MRSLRYNESFNSISFRNVDLTILHAQVDTLGDDHVPYTTKSGEPLNMPQQRDSWLLIHEIQALALKSKKLRRLDFTNCITRIPIDYDDSRDVGCGICEALFPLCARQLTNVDWITLNGIPLADADIDYLYAAAINKLCHFRALELGSCALGKLVISHVLIPYITSMSQRQCNKIVFLKYCNSGSAVRISIHRLADVPKAIETCRPVSTLSHIRILLWSPLISLVIQHGLIRTPFG